MSEAKCIDMDNLQTQLSTATEEVEALLTNSDDSSHRTSLRKQILKRELESLLYTLNVNDAETVRVHRTEILQSLLTHKQEAKRILAKIADCLSNVTTPAINIAGPRRSTSLDSVDLSLQLHKFQEQIVKIRSLKQYSCLEIGSDLQSFRRLADHSIYVKSKLLDPKGFKLFIHPCINSIARAIIFCVNNQHSFREEFVRNSMELTYNAINAEEDRISTIPLFKASLSTLLEREQACLLSDNKAEILLRPSPTTVGVLEVKVLGVNIVDSSSKPFTIFITDKGEHSVFLNDTVSYVEPAVSSCGSGPYVPSGTRGSTGSSVSREALPFGSPQPPINNATSRETEDDRKEESKNSMSKVYSKLGLVCYNCIDSSCFDLSGYKNQSVDRSVIPRGSVTGMSKDDEFGNADPTGTNCLDASKWEYTDRQTNGFKDATFAELIRYPTKIIAESCTRTLRCLEYPSYLTISRYTTMSNDSSSSNNTGSVLFYDSVLVSEPSHERIGVYDADSLAFVGWFSAPGFKQDRCTNVLALGNHVVVLNRLGVHLFQRGDGILEYSYEKCSPGIFRGLAGCEDLGLFWTIEKSMVIREFRVDEEESKSLTHVEDINIDNTSTVEGLIVDQFVFLNNKFYISNASNNSVIVIDRETRKQTEMELETPTSVINCCLLVDNSGYILLVDATLNKSRLVVFSPKGEFVKEVLMQPEGNDDSSLDPTPNSFNDDNGDVDRAFSKVMRCPCAIQRHKDSVLVAFKGRNQRGAGIIRYSLRKKSSFENNEDIIDPSTD